jgi:serine/threonine protein kinase
MSPLASFFPFDDGNDSGHSMAMMNEAALSLGKDSVIELDQSGGSNPRFAQGAFGDISIALFRDFSQGEEEALDRPRKHVYKDTPSTVDSQGRFRFVAVKTIKLSKNQTEFGELQAWRQLYNHRNVVSLLAIYPSSDISFKFVSEYCPTDLYVSLEWRRRRQPKLQLSLSSMKLIMTDLLTALQFMHTSPHCMIHNDIKPGNILISTLGVMKLCDFGLAKKFDPELDCMYRQRLEKESNKSSNVRQGMTTLHYRSPEVLLGGESNNPAIDIYSVGLVLAELLTGRTLFQGRNEMDQLHQIFSHLGTPSDVNWPKSKLLPYGSHFKFVDQPAKNILDYIPRCAECTTLHEFLTMVLTLDPEQRLPAAKGLQHPWLICQPPETKRRLFLQKELIPQELVEPFIMHDVAADADLTVPRQQALDLATTRRSFLAEMDLWTKEKAVDY